MSMTNVRPKYSWWWDSHICPKNSKWLKENLADMDSKIKLMIKIIEEDAESFAQKAEMYYRRRPELMTLLEELYRAYRALAERYDHAAGELRLVHRKIAEAFPDQVLLDLDDDLPAETASIETDTDNSDMTPFVLSFINAGDSNKRVRDDQELQKEISRLSQENQELKKKISSVLEQSDKAESEVLSLKEALAQQEVEKKAAILQCQQSGARLLNLKSEILQTQEEFKRLKKEMQTSRQQPLSAAEEQCLLLERANKDLHLELDKLKRASEEQHVELEKLSISLQEEKLKSMQAEMARLPLEKQLAQEQEKLRHLALEKHSEANKLKDIETSEVRLQKELEKIQEENHKLDGQNRSSTAVIIRLQDEIISLKNAQRRLEEEVSRHVKEKMALGDELSHLKEDRSNLERNHFSIKEQIQVVNFNVESLQALAQEVRDGNVELKEIIKNHEELKVLHLKNLRQPEMMSEKNAHLEKSLLDATAKLEGLQENKVALEESCKYLSSKISSHQSERSTLVAQIEAISQSMEKLLEKNVFLENSLLDANAELEGLRRKLKELEESSKALHNQNFVLRSEKRTLISKVDSISDTLLNLETQYAELEWRNSDLQHEKNSVLDEVIKLQELIRKEREEHKELSHSSNTQFGALQKQIRLLVEEGQHREKQLEKVEHQIGKAQIEIFILHRCLCDMAEVNSDLTAQLQKHQEVCKVQEEQLGHLSQHNQTLTKWISSVVEVLHLDRMYESLDQMNLDIVVQLILHEIKCLLNTISDAQDVKQKQLLEKSLVVTLLEHFGQEIADLRSERNSLKQEWQAKSEELLQLQSERHDLLKISDNFWNGVEARNHKVEELKAEAKFLGGQLSELQVFRRSLEGEIVKLIEENSSLSNKLYNFMEKEMMFEDDFSTLLGEAVSTDILSVIFRSLHEERTLQLQSLQNEFASLHIAGNELYQEIRMMNKKFGDLELENDYLKKDPNRTMSICDRSGAGLDTGKRSNIQQGCGINMEQHEVGCCVLEKSNDTLWEELQMLQSELEVLRAKERAVIDVKSCDAEITKLLTNMQMAIMNAALFKEKVLELIITCESFEISAMVEKEVLKEEITRRNSYVDKLKDKLNAAKIENRRLKVDLNGDFTLLGSLQTEVNALERETLSLAKDCLPSNHRTQENALSPQLSKIIVYPIDDQNAVKMVKDMELHKLHGTNKALQKVVMDTGVLLEKERLDFNGNLQEARKQIEMLKLKDILDDDLSEINYEQMLKDIQLDLMQTSSGCITDSFQQKESKNAAQSNNKMLRYRGMVRANDDNLRHDDLRPPQSEALERDNGKQSSSEPMVVKELSIDMQELPRSAATEPHQEWKKTVIERLSSDAQRLAVLQSGIQELKTAIEAPDEFELESLKAQIREAEATISQLIDTNGKLSEKAEEFASTDELDGENIDLRSRSQRKILERAKKMSEKIGRLELEMQKVQKALLKHEEENASRHTPIDMQRRSRVQLMQYLYGRRRDSQRQKRGSSCCCMRAKTIDD